MTYDFDMMVNDYLKYNPHFSRSTVKNIQWITRNIKPFLPQDVRMIKSDHLNSWYAANRTKGLTSSTLRLMVTMVKRIFSRSVSMGYLHRNPSDSLVHSYSHGNFRRMLIPDEVLWKIVQAAKCSCRDYAMMLLLYECGLRSGELRTIDKEDFDQQQKLLMVNSRSNRGRRIPLSTECCTALCYYLDSRRDTYRQLLLSQKGDPLSDHVVPSVIRKYARLAGVDVRVNAYDYRVALVVRLFESGISIIRIGMFLGYSTLEGLFKNLQFSKPIY